MYIKVRSIDLKEKVTLLVSRNTLITKLKVNIEDALNVKPEKQRLFFRGKQLEDAYTIFDYDININDVVQLMIKPDIKETENVEPEKRRAQEPHVTSKYFKIGDSIDVLDRNYGAWFEGRVVLIKLKSEITADESKSLSPQPDDGLVYYVEYEGEDSHVEPFMGTINNIRPRCCCRYKFDDLKIGEKVLVNYNVENPEARGYWYDFEVTGLSNVRGDKKLTGTLLIGTERVPLENVTVKFSDHVMRIEEIQKLGECTSNTPNHVNGEESKRDVGESEEKGPDCEHCKDNARRKCKFCGCYICGGKHDPAKLILCDECDQAYHLGCLNPPLPAVPETDDWYCPECKNDASEIVHAGEKLKESKKKARMASKKKPLQASVRDWGKGMACVGRTKVCTIVPRHHYGPIPGVEVGSSWLYRLGVSESGVHRPHVAGIHGRASDGAYSIVLSGGYEDDVDNGETFMYTGSGGRDLSGNKRTAAQTKHQTLTRMNKALAQNCNVPLSQKGGKAQDWRKGKPIRVVRSFKLSRHSKYAPEEGCRYDGIYKVMEYYPKKGKSGFIVWRYKLCRDDPIPAPWTPEGKKRIEKLGLTMVYPEGYLEAMDAKSKTTERKAVKRSLDDSIVEMPEKKRVKMSSFKLEKDIVSLLAADKVNEKIWNICRGAVKDGKQMFLQCVEDNFMCICCQELVYNPVTTKCKHNLCASCLRRSFEAEVYSCPCCRFTLSPQKRLKINENLRKALVALFPGYEAGR